MIKFKFKKSIGAANFLDHNLIIYKHSFYKFSFNKFLKFKLCLIYQFCFIKMLSPDIVTTIFLLDKNLFV